MTLPNILSSSLDNSPINNKKIFNIFEEKNNVISPRIT